MRPLAGARVLDLTRSTLGALCSRHLADLGAVVIRVEEAPSDRTTDARWRLRNRSKRVLVAKGGLTDRHAVSGYAAVVTDTSDGAEAAQGIDAVIVRLRDVRGEGLLADEPSPDYGMSALGGLTFITGDPRGKPRTPRDVLATRLGALYAACVTCASIVAPTTRSVIDILPLEAVASCLESTLPFWFVEHRVTMRATDMNDLAWPVSIYATRDGWVGISAGRLEDTRRLLALLDLQDLVAPSVRDYTDLKHLEVLDGKLSSRLQRFTAQDLVRACQGARVAAAAAVTPPDLPADEQARARRFVREWPDGTVVLTIPLSEVGTRRAVPQPPRLIERVLREPSVPAATRHRGELPLAGFRILDFTWALAGPFATMILADLGADVAKVESRDHVDSSRLVAPYLGFPDIERSGYFRFFNRNKRSMEFDFTRADDRQSLLELARSAHAAVENLRPGSLDAKGLGYRDLGRNNARLVMCSISGFGRRGPRSGWASYGGAMAECANGLAMATGEDRPIVPGRALGDIFTGLYAALGMCAQLYQRVRRGRGSYYEVTQFEAGAAALEELIALGPDSSEKHRIEGSDDSGWTATGTAGRWPVADAAEVARQLESSGAIQRFSTTEGVDDFVRLPALLDGSRVQIRRRSPRLGEHTSEVSSAWAAAPLQEVEG
jgi:crotonobetainyl-CoA:carnitine CoA-transferase CaiB-like acyl-CoA transferase